MYKIGFIGNSSVGKTTSAFSLIRLLKFLKARTGYCEDACRFVSFDPNLFDTNPHARLHVLFKQFSNEAMHQCRHDTDYLITERTTLDWYLYYKWTCKNIGVDPDVNITNLVEANIASYNVLFYMDSTGIDYINDGYRPASTKIRDEIDPMYKTALDHLYRSYSGTLFVVNDPNIQSRTATVEAMFTEWLKTNTLIR